MYKKLIIGIIAFLSLNTAIAQQKTKPANAKKTKNKTATTKRKSSVNAANKTTTILNQEYTTASGLKYRVTELGTGKQVSVGDKVTVHYTGKLTNGTKFDSSKDRNQPFIFKVGEGRVIKGWDEGLALLKIGDKATFVIPPAIGYGEQDMGQIPPNSTLVFDIEVLDAVTPTATVKPVPYDVKGKDTITTSSGLRYIKVADGNGVRAENGKVVDVHYTGYLLNGKQFDSSIERGEPISFPLGNGMVIKGWEEGIALMKTGDKFRLIIPSDIAYGPSGRGSVIPPDATLIFDVELVNVK
ncbi:MAG: FKBP-type peptidyl-prolyl cis-trans isomerase [Bacteroidia bacterium]|nr:FKBP-type peptidyl-prolyl cis-trans isomerase [Bacteroidia bacterium]